MNEINTHKILIDKSFLDLRKKISKGLISGLIILSRKGFAIEFKNQRLDKNSQLKRILDLEDITLTDNSKTPHSFYITTRSVKEISAIKVSPKGKIKNFEEAVNEISKTLRSAVHRRKTKETDIRISLSLDGKGKSKIKTGIGFFDHMLEQIARHSNINLNISVKGDLHIDEHHTVEDVGITLGNALTEALGNKSGIKRYGYFLPMDDSIAQCAVDLGGRTYLNFNCNFKREKVGEFPTELTEEFFRAIASGLKANIYIKASGKNDHHKIEAIFKAFAKSLNEACRIDNRGKGNLPTTKGVL